MADEGASMRGPTILFGIIIAGIVIIFLVVIFPVSNLIRETVVVEGVIAASSRGECVVDTPDNVPRVIKDCDLPVGSKVTVSYQEGMFEAKLVSQP